MPYSDNNLDTKRYSKTLKLTEAKQTEVYILLPEELMKNSARENLTNLAKKNETCSLSIFKISFFHPDQATYVTQRPGTKNTPWLPFLDHIKEKIVIKRTKLGPKRPKNASQKSKGNAIKCPISRLEV